MRKLLVSALIAVLAISCCSSLIIPALAQATTPTPDGTAAPVTPLIIRWMRFRGAITSWGDQPYHGTVTVNAKTANVAPTVFRPWVTVDAVWSNEKRPLATDEKPVGQVSYTHYTARLVGLQSIIGKRMDPNYNLVITGLWNINKVKVTVEFDDDGVLLKVTREVTPLATRAKGQMHIAEDWKKFDIKVDGVDVVKGNGIGMSTSTNAINQFSFNQDARPTLRDLFQIVKSYRAMPGFGNYLPELDYNLDSKISLADLTTVGAHM
jgi:hypothetical protein